MDIGMKTLKISAIYMVAGLVLGLLMGISGNFALTSVHAHGLLLGWATMALAGFVYILLPECGRSRLAKAHFWGHNAGLPLMMAGLGLHVYGVEAAAPLVPVSSILVLVSLVLFAINLFLNGRAGRQA